MKKVVSLLMVLMLCMGIMTANAEEMQTLSEMSDVECIAFLHENEVTIPRWHETELEWAPFIKAVILRVEENPNVTFGFGHTDLLDFAEDIKTAVIAHYGFNVNMRASGSSTTNILEDNWVSGTWSSAYSSYNCYAYAIGETNRLNPGELSGNTSAGTLDAYTLATYAKADLEALGYHGVYISSALHTTSNVEKVICFRTGGWYDDDNLCMTNDYHVMCCDYDGYWYHKPGGTNPLKYKYTPNYKNWIYEAFDGTTYERNESVRYTSTIWYVIYEPHIYKYTYCGNSRHILTCTTCGVTTGSAVSCSMSGNTCRVCGHTSGGGFEIMSLDRH